MKDGAEKVPVRAGLFSNLPGLGPSCPGSPKEQKSGGSAERRRKEGDFELRVPRTGYAEVGVSQEDNVVANLSFLNHQRLGWNSLGYWVAV